MRQATPTLRRKQGLSTLFPAHKVSFNGAIHVEHILHLHAATSHLCYCKFFALSSFRTFLWFRPFAWTVLTYTGAEWVSATACLWYGSPHGEASSVHHTMQHDMEKRCIDSAYFRPGNPFQPQLPTIIRLRLSHIHFISEFNSNTLYWCHGYSPRQSESWFGPYTRSGNTSLYTHESGSGLDYIVFVWHSPFCRKGYWPINLRTTPISSKTRKHSSWVRTRVFDHRKG